MVCVCVRECLYVCHLSRRDHTAHGAAHDPRPRSPYPHVQCFFAMRTWGNPQAEFKVEMTRLAKYLLCNPVLRAEQAAAGGPARSPSSTVHSARAGSPYSPTDCSEHVLVPLSSIKGYKGAKQQRCNVCNIATSWACITCSPSADVVWPCHPRKTTARKKTTVWACFDKRC